MNFPVDDIALDQAGALGGVPRRHPKDDYSLVDLLEVDVIRRASALTKARTIQASDGLSSLPEPLPDNTRPA